jgi:hypothetical protein
MAEGRPYDSLIVSLNNGDEVRLDVHARPAGGREVTVTMTNSQTVRECFWLEEGASTPITNEQRVKKLIRYVHDRNRPSYAKALDVLRPYMPNWIVHMNGYVMLAFYVALAASTWFAYREFGRSGLPLLFPVALLVVALTLGFDESDIGVDLDFSTLEVTAHTMLGKLPEGSVRVPLRV